MKIVILGSLTFYDDMVRAKQELVARGHLCITPKDVVPETPDSYSGDLVRSRNAEEKITYDLIGRYFRVIGENDAILEINNTKKGIENYVGGNGLIEMAFAHVQGRGIYLLNPIPEGVSYSDEIRAMKPIILNGKLELIE